MIVFLKEEKQMEKKQVINPYLPNWEYVPDGEPYCLRRPGLCLRIA